MIPFNEWGGAGVAAMITCCLREQTNPGVSLLTAATLTFWHAVWAIFVVRKVRLQGKRQDLDPSRIAGAAG